MRVGAVDTETKAYLSNPEYFSDVFNFWLYGGRQVIRADNLTELDTTVIALPYGVDAKEPIQRFRDILKLYKAMRDNEAIYLMFGIEAQSEIHYAMPVRNMLYDAMNYVKQVSEATASYKRNEISLPHKEFLSGFRKDDRLLPVITLTVSFSHEPWDGPTSLHEMLAIENKELLKYVADYKLNLLTPHDIAEEDFDKFRTEFGAVMQCVKHRQDKDMKWMEGKDRFKKMTHGTASLIKTVTGFNLDLDKEGDVVNMMNAWENGLNQARVDAKQAGRNEGRNEGHNDMMIAIRMIRENQPANVIREQTGLSEQNLTELRSML